MPKVCEGNSLPASLLLISFIKYLEHLVSIAFVDNNCTEVDVSASELLYLLFNVPALRVTLRKTIIVVIMVLFSMCRSISEKDAILAFCSPCLIKPVLKATSNIFRAISATCCIKLRDELLTSSDVITELENLCNFITIAVVSVGHY